MIEVFKPKKIQFFLNHKSGGTDKSAIPLQIKTFCERHGITCSIVELNKDNKCDLEQEIKQFGPDMVVAAGGDGTVNALGKVVYNTDIVLGIIPLGSSNGLAKNLHIPIDLKSAVSTLYESHIKEIDTLLINGHHCFHLCDIGFNANLIKRSHKSKLRGWFTYGWNLFRELFDFHFFTYALETPREKLKGRAFSITITNTKFYGTKAAINPKGKINDGLFEICIIKPFPKWAMLPMFIQLFKGRINHSPYSAFIRTEKAILKNLDWETVHIDGEPVKLGKEIDVYILPKSLKIAVPKGIN